MIDNLTSQEFRHGLFGVKKATRHAFFSDSSWILSYKSEFIGWATKKGDSILFTFLPTSRIQREHFPLEDIRALIITIDAIYK